MTDSSSKGLSGKHVGMTTFSHYPFDPRPRRAIDAFLKAGMTIDLVCLADEKAPSRESGQGIEIFRVPLKHKRGGKLSYGYNYSAFILASAFLFTLRTLKKKYDLIYVHNMPDVLVASALIPKLLGTKVILDLHDPMPELMMTIFNKPEDSRSVRILKGLEKWSLTRANTVLTVNVTCKKIFAERSCPADKIHVVMNSPDPAIFRLRESKPADSDGSTRTKPFVIMYHGSLVERNGLDLAVDALACVRERLPTAELRVYGPSTAFLERVMEGAKQKGVADAIRYLGKRRLEDLVPEIEQCDVGVIPNHRNTFTEINTPTRIFEYLAAGKPVIAPRTRGIQDYFSDDSLLFFEPGNSASLSERIEFAYLHPKEVVEIGRKGQEIYRAHTWEQEREVLLDTVANLLKADKHS